MSMRVARGIYCFLWFKDTKMKANHNSLQLLHFLTDTVSYGSKDTKMKANHNMVTNNHKLSYTVSYGSKILK